MLRTSTSEVTGPAKNQGLRRNTAEPSPSPWRRYPTGADHAQRRSCGFALPPIKPASTLAPHLPRAGRLQIVLVVVLVLVLVHDSLAPHPRVRGRGPFAALTEDEDDCLRSSLDLSSRRTSILAASMSQMLPTAIFHSSLPPRQRSRPGSMGNVTLHECGRKRYEAPACVVRREVGADPASSPPWRRYPTGADNARSGASGFVHHQVRPASTSRSVPSSRGSDTRATRQHPPAPLPAGTAAVTPRSTARTSHAPAFVVVLVLVLVLESPRRLRIRGRGRCRSVIPSSSLPQSRVEPLCDGGYVRPLRWPHPIPSSSSPLIKPYGGSSPVRLSVFPP